MTFIRISVTQHEALARNKLKSWSASEDSHKEVCLHFVTFRPIHIQMAIGSINLIDMRKS